MIPAKFPLHSLTRISSDRKLFDFVVKNRGDCSRQLLITTWVNQNTALFILHCVRYPAGPRGDDRFPCSGGFLGNHAKALDIEPKIQNRQHYDIAQSVKLNQFAVANRAEPAHMAGKFIALNRLTNPAGNIVMVRLRLRWVFAGD